MVLKWILVAIQSSPPQANTPPHAISQQTIKQSQDSVNIQSTSVNIQSTYSQHTVNMEVSSEENIVKTYSFFEKMDSSGQQDNNIFLIRNN